MNPTCILIAESGSTKTDWCLIRNGRKKQLQTQGINPYFMQEKEILLVLERELNLRPEKHCPDEIHFYGAGINSSDTRTRISTALKKYFSTRKVYCYSDMLASARSTCLRSRGIACILGTGSNTCLYTGKTIGFKTHSLGYVLGDEGGGTALGRRVLQHYLQQIFDRDLQKKFEESYESDKEVIMENLYRKPLPNRYLASFANFILENRGHYMIENIAEDCLNELFINHLIRYPGVHKLPVHFTGSVAWYLRDILENLCAQYEMTLGTVYQKPMPGLISYHLG